MSESYYRSQVIELLRPLHAISVECPIHAGIPDINCSLGWIEMKHLSEWPKRNSTIVRPPHFEKEQRDFLLKRCSVGAKAWLLLVVASDWCLVWGAAAAKHLGVSWTQSDLVGNPNAQVRHWAHKPSSPDLIRTLMFHDWLSGDK